MEKERPNVAGQSDDLTRRELLTDPSGLCLSDSTVDARWLKQPQAFEIIRAKCV